MLKAFGLAGYVDKLGHGVLHRVALLEDLLGHLGGELAGFALLLLARIAIAQRVTQRALRYSVGKRKQTNKQTTQENVYL